MSLDEYIKNIIPKFNKEIVEGLCFHRLKKAHEYISDFIKYSVEDKTSTHLKYIGYKILTPEEEIKFLFAGGNKSAKKVYDIAESYIYMAEYKFRYADEDKDRSFLVYLPYVEKGNIIMLSGSKFLVMPLLSDQVISVGDKVLFINILTAKYNFDRVSYVIKVNKKFMSVNVIITELYKNPGRKKEPTTKAYITVMHYLLANYGFDYVANSILGFIPRVVYDVTEKDYRDYYVFESNDKEIPHGYIHDKSKYVRTRIKFLVSKDSITSNDILAKVTYFIGNVFYIIDHFSEMIIDQVRLNDTVLLKKLLGDIIHSGNHTYGYIMEKINNHFNDLNSSFNHIVKTKLMRFIENKKFSYKDDKSSEFKINNLMELLMFIFDKYNELNLLSSRLNYINKTYEVETVILNDITSAITRLVLDINKEEHKNNKNPLPSKIVDNIFKKYLKTRLIFKIKDSRFKVTSIDYCGDHLYPKNTAMVVEQESDFININRKDVNTSERRSKKITAYMSYIGSILGLSKKNPTPVIRINPYLKLNSNGEILITESELEYLKEQDELLSTTIDVQDISVKIEDNDKVEEDFLFEIIEDTDDDYEQIEFDYDFDDRDDGETLDIEVD